MSITGHATGLFHLCVPYREMAANIPCVHHVNCMKFDTSEMCGIHVTCSLQDLYQTCKCGMSYGNPVYMKVQEIQFFFQCDLVYGFAGKLIKVL